MKFLVKYSAVVVFFIAIVYLKMFFFPDIDERTHFSTITGRLTSYECINCKHDYTIHIIVNNDTKRVFDVPTSVFKKESFEKNVKIGDEISLLVPTELHNEHSIILSLIDKGWQILKSPQNKKKKVIQIYSLEAKSKNYLNFKEALLAEKSTEHVALFIGIILLISSIYTFFFYF